MKKYKRDNFIWLHQTGRFTEAVIHVEKYLNILRDELKQLHRDLITFKGDTLQLFNERFYTYKIQFSLIDSFEGSSSVVEGRVNRDNITILVNEDFYFYTSKENLDVFNQFEKDLCILFSHELVHRGQYYVRAGDKINFYNFEGYSLEKVDPEYLKNPREAMAYAMMYIESLRYSGYKNEHILSILKTGNFARSQSLHINFYINEMKTYNRNAFLQFRKYIYQYMVDPVRYDLKLLV